MGYRRFVFCILNALITVASLAVLSIGGLTTAHPNYVATLLATGSSSVSSLGQRTQSEFQIQEVEIADVDKYERAGKCLLILGVFVFGTALLGWWTWRSMKEPTLTAVKLLVIYTDMLLVLTMVQAGLTGDYLDWYAKIPSRMKDYYEINTIASNYVVGGTDLYSLNVNLLHFLYDCCGIFEADDFQSHNLSSLPPSCCKASIVRGGNLTMQSACISGTADPQYYSQKGCHSQAERKVTNNLTAMVITVTLVLLLQAVQVILSSVFLNHPGHGDTAKLTPKGATPPQAVDARVKRVQVNPTFVLEKPPCSTVPTERLAVTDIDRLDAPTSDSGGNEREVPWGSVSRLRLEVPLV